MISHSNLNDNLFKIGNELQTSTSTVCVSWLPQYHDMGLIGSYLGLLYCGGSGFYLSPLTFLQRPMLWLEVVNKYRGTHLQAPNFAYKLTARKFEARAYSEESLNLSCIQHMINAAEPVTEASIEAFQAAFGPFGLNPNVMFPTYGLAEHTVFVCSGGRQRLTVSKSKLEVDGVVQIASSLSSDTDSSRLIGCGYPAKQNVDVRIVDTSTMQEREEDQVGEIWVRSESKARGYYQKPLESKSEFCAQLGSTPESAINDDVNDLEVDYDSSEGYLRTGDLGFMHGGELFICGRMKDLIIVGGRNYYPQDIEATVEGTSKLIRPGCSAAFTVDPVSGQGEQVAVVLELREVPKAQVGKRNQRFFNLVA
jgi:acyl-CoA synthetase (AMP-forming)/AMP-acid ligase II